MAPRSRSPLRTLAKPSSTAQDAQAQGSSCPPLHGSPTRQNYQQRCAPSPPAPWGRPSNSQLTCLPVARGSVSRVVQSDSHRVCANSQSDERVTVTIASTTVCYRIPCPHPFVLQETRVSALAGSFGNFVLCMLALELQPPWPRILPALTMRSPNYLYRGFLAHSSKLLLLHFRSSKYHSQHIPRTYSFSSSSI